MQLNDILQARCLKEGEVDAVRFAAEIVSSRRSLVLGEGLASSLASSLSQSRGVVLPRSAIKAQPLGSDDIPFHSRRVAALIGSSMRGM